MKGKDLTPLMMWFCLFTGIIILALVRPGRIPSPWDGHSLNCDTLFIGLYLLWLVIESRVSAKDVEAVGKKTSDAATCQIYGLGQALTVFSALWFPPGWKGPNLAHWLGIALFCFGIGYRLWAIRTMGQLYSHRVRTVAQHHIVTSGPYRFTRHPAYAGMIIANAGICLYFCNRVTLCIFLFLLLPAILFRIVIEEKTLFQIEGYAEFASARKRLFPKVW